MNTRGVQWQGAKRAGEPPFDVHFPEHPPMLTNFTVDRWDDAQQHLGQQGPCPARAKQGLESGGTSSLCGSFQPNSCSVCVSILPDATTAELVIFREQRIAFPQTSVWQGTGGDLAGEFQPPRPVCPVGVFLFGRTGMQKGNIKCWLISVHVQTLQQN